MFSNANGKRRLSGQRFMFVVVFVVVFSSVRCGYFLRQSQAVITASAPRGPK